MWHLSVSSCSFLPINIENKTLSKYKQTLAEYKQKEWQL
jgi:hypothetical protein